MHHSTFRRIVSGLAVLLAASGGTGAFAADLSLMPVAVHLDRAHDRATVHVANKGNAPVVLQAEAIAWQREGGVDRDESSDDLIVNPSVFTLAPGKTQIVRVGLRRDTQADRESTYRMVLREVPGPAGVDNVNVQGNVRVLVALRVPVYVAPAAVRREERWHARYDADGTLVAQVSNDGNVHYKVGSLRVEGDEGHPTVVAQGPQSVLFPGEVRSFRLPATGTTNLPRSSQPLTLEVLTDRGVQHVALDFSTR